MGERIASPPPSQGVKLDFDTVVVGAGPIGSAVARDIARAGYQVLLLEEHASIGTPCHCSGLVTPRTLEVAGVSEDVVINRIRGAIVHCMSGAQLPLRGDRVHALAIDRIAFDQQLAQQATDSGAVLWLQARLIDIDRGKDCMRLTVRRGKEEVTVNARLIVGADGARSTVAERVGYSPDCEYIQALGAEASVTVEPLDMVHVYVGQEIAPHWFGWAIPLGRRRARIGTGQGNSGAVPLKGLLDGLIEAFPQQFADADVSHYYGGAIPIYAPVRTYDDNLLLVGDAARQVKPTSGGGVYTGLVAARHCADAAIYALRHKDYTRHSLSRYEVAWRAALGPELERGLELRKVFASLSDRDFHRLLSMLNRPQAQRVITRYGDIDSPSLMFGHLLRVSPRLLTLIHVPLRPRVIMPLLRLAARRNAR